VRFYYRCTVTHPGHETGIYFHDLMAEDQKSAQKYSIRFGKSVFMMMNDLTDDYRLLIKGSVHLFPTKEAWEAAAGETGINFISPEYLLRKTS
jgi:hypothetical protein